MIFFNNETQIGVQPMYLCGCLKWLLELHKNNIVPGIVWNSQQTLLDHLTDKEWSHFFKQTDEIIVAVNAGSFRDINFHKWFLKYKPKYVEIYNSLSDSNKPRLGSDPFDDKVISLIRGQGSKIYIKQINANFQTDMDKLASRVDAVNVKNNKGAGSTSEQTLEQSIDWGKSKYKMPIIVSGGLGSRQDIQTAFDLGADAVLLGTLFAASEESNLAPETKLLMVERNSLDINLLTNENRRGLIKGNIIENDNGNMTKNLENLIKEGKDGIVYAGAGIDHIKKILPIKEIVQSILPK